MGTLKGKKILVTREASQAKKFSEQIKAAGGIPIEVPLLKINCKSFYPPGSIQDYDWVIFTSINGVTCFLNQLTKNEIRALKNSQIAVVGQKTAEALADYDLTADLVPEVYNADSLAAFFLEKHQQGETILLVRGNKARDVLPKVFSEKGIPFEAVEVYETLINKENATNLQNTMHDELFDYITFTSPSTVQAFMELSGKYSYTAIPCVCIGTTTEVAAREAGFQSIITAETFTMEGMIKVMQDKIHNEKRNG